ncbi:uncharacterized protein LOC119918025 isoform X2 [Micropterus salmoides]|uniref:uncharacterized protein LOC119918025 isoform X2 n=1 Tax=Micropterus salmoides TaxID=27706 RepID=UPI0018ED6135|nr:uncharacterized protein LOC119918025 isoform X2 [Micropterus salmoides]
MLHLYCGQQRECSKGNFHIPEESHLNNNTRLQQRRDLNYALSAGTSSAAPQEDYLGITFPLQDQCSFVSESKQETMCPLLYNLLKANPPDSKSRTSPCPSSEEILTEMNSDTNFSDMNCRGGQVKSSQTALNCGQTTTQHLDHSRGTHFTLRQQQVSPSSVSAQLSINKVSTVEETEPIDDQKLDFIVKRLAKLYKNKNNGHPHINKGWNFCTDRNLTLPSDGIMSNSVAHLPTTSASDKDDVERQSAVIAQRTAAAGQKGEDRSKGSKADADLLIKSKETGYCSTSVSEKPSTEYPQIMMKVAANCAKSEDESPVVLTAMSEVTLDEPTEKHSSMLNCRLPQEEYKPLHLNIKNLDDTHQVPSVGWFKYMTEEEKGDAGLKPVETLGLDNVHTKSSLEVSENKMLLENPKNNLAKQHWDVGNKDVIAHPKLNSSIDNIFHVSMQSEMVCNQTSRAGVREDAGSVLSQTDLRTAVYENKVKEHAPLFKGKGEEAHLVQILKDPFYEDISDEDIKTSQLAKITPNTEHAESSFAVYYEDPQYEDISEDENVQMENMSVERPLLTQVPERNDKQSPLENKGHEHGQTHMKMAVISDIAQHCSPCFMETDDFDLSPKCDSNRHLGLPTNHSISCSPSSFLNDETDQMEEDDDWTVIPISISDLKFEMDDEDQDSPENVLLDDDETGDKERSYDRSSTHHESPWPAPKPGPASASTGKLEVFDTIQSFQQAKCLQFKNIFEVVSDKCLSEHEVDSGGEAYKLQNRSESEHEDSCDTEDSCDYSSGPEHNYMTVHRKFWKKRSAPLLPETDEDVSEREGEDNDVIIIDSDTEDGGDGPYSQQKRQSPETVNSWCGTTEEKFPKNRLPTEMGFKEVTQDACSDRSHSTGESGQPIETKAGSDHVKQKTDRQKIAKKDDVIILDSDTGDDDDQNYKKKANRKRFSSGSTDGGDAPCVQQKRHAPETAGSRCGNIKTKFKKSRLPSADSSLPQHQSKVDDTQFKEVMQDACSNQSHSVKKSGHLIGTKGGSDHVQHKTNRQITSKRKVSHDSDEVLKKDNFSKKKTNTKNILPSGSEDSCDSLFAKQSSPSTETVDHLCGTANEKPEKNTQSFKDLPEKQLQSVDTVSQNPVIPRFLVQWSPQPNDYLQLLKESRVHRQDKDETQGPKRPTPTRKQTDSSGINMTHLFRNKKGRFVSKPQLADELHHATKNKFQANVTKPKLSSPSQEGPPTSTFSFSSCGKGSEARQSSASQRGLSQSGETSTSSSLPKSKQNPSIPRNVSSSTLRRSHSNGNPSTLDHPYTPTQGQSSATMQSSARKQVTAEWQDGYYPTRRDRKTSLGMEDDLKTTNHNSGREARPGPRHYDRAPKLRRNLDSATPLMKKSQIDAKQWTKAITRDAPRELGSGVKSHRSGQRTVATPTKGDASRIKDQGFGRKGKKRRSTIPL